VQTCIMAQLMPLPPTVSCFSKIQIGFTFLVPAHLGSLRQRAVKRVCVCVSWLPVFIFYACSNVFFTFFIIAMPLLLTHDLHVCLIRVVWSEVQTCIWPSWCHCHSLSLASVKSRLVFIFLVLAHLGCPGKEAIKWLCVVMCCSINTQLLKKVN